jgi:hypothetical protein
LWREHAIALKYTLDRCGYLLYRQTIGAKKFPLWHIQMKENNKFLDQRLSVRHHGAMIVDAKLPFHQLPLTDRPTYPALVVAEIACLRQLTSKLLRWT